MRHLISLTLFCTMILPCAAQKVYDSNGSVGRFASESSTITFSAPYFTWERPAGAAARGRESALAAALIPAALDIGFAYLDSLLKERVKRFSSEFATHQTYKEQTVEQRTVMAMVRDGKEYVEKPAEVKKESIPSFTVTRTVDTRNGGTYTLALTFEVAAFDQVRSACFFELKAIDLQGSRAKVKSGDRLDYTVEVKPTFLVDKDGGVQKETIGLAPVRINAVGFGKTDMSDRHIRTEALLVPAGTFVELDVKVSETNPRRVKAEAVVELWTKNRDGLRKLVDQFVPQAAGGNAEGEDGN